MKHRKHKARAARHIAETGTALAKRFRTDAEMAAAATRVVVQRTVMLSEAMAKQDLRAGSEIARMGAEKVSAAAQAGTAALVESFGAGRLWLDLYFRQAARSMALASAFAGQRAPSEVSRTAEAMWTDLLDTGAAMARLATDVADAAIKPIHRTAVANAKRLTR